MENILLLTLLKFKKYHIHFLFSVFMLNSAQNLKIQFRSNFID